MLKKPGTSWNTMACFLGILGACPPQMEPLGVALQKMGLIEMRSPREVWPVGTIVAIKRDQWGRITEVPDVCNPIFVNPSLVKEGKSYMREKTKDTSELEHASTSGGLALNGVSVGDVKAGLGANGQFLSGINLEISNARILYADDVTLSNTADALVQDPKCSESVNKRRLAGYEITALDKVLVADLTYKVSLSGDFSGDARASLLKQVGAQLKASYDEGSQTLVKGGGLTFGFSVASVSPVTTTVHQ